ncbi:GMC oxidoreductase [Amniculicola lignicola CBS 123094]|uniref:GMC oxidoreductase n=1 Tax=Amniculicola lignicola CBS 123094 TaxID=1392246 RepID=A0A6A5W457_9PLEO|nr:GMC oxidoreductase [Amniculicola lignicola CBS 123094]
MKLKTLFLALSALQSVAIGTSPQSRATSQPRNEANTYDYIVTGSGPGGGTIAVNLARAGYSVLLIEAGSDESSNIATQILSLGQLGNPGPVAWHFFVRHSEDPEQLKRYNLLVWRLSDRSYWVGKTPPVGQEKAEMLGVYYPRGATLGGSAIVNAAATFLPSDSDWDFFDKGTGDGIWGGKDMRRIFKKIEHNNYLASNTPGHGFAGWLQTNIGDRSLYGSSNLKLAVVKAGLKLIGKDPEKAVDYMVSDGNFLDPKRDQMEGLWALPFHVEKNWKRFSPRDRILATLSEKTADGKQKYPLYVQLSSLTTKIIFDRRHGGILNKPKAIGVEYLEGTAVYKGDPRWNSTIKGKKGVAYARKEVIVSGGTFSTPQLLQLSGVGPKALLEKFNISVISDLPGVGRNLQDNYEMPIVGQAKVKIASVPDPSGPACTFGAPGDPCVALWRNGTGPYAHGGDNAFSMLLKTKFSPDGERDMLLFSTPGALRGFRPPTNQSFIDPPNTFSWSTVKMHPQNGAGVIKIKSADPQEMPDINFNHFVEGGKTDLGAILETVAWGRKTFFGTEAPVGPVVPQEPPCPGVDIRANGYCKDAEVDEQWIKDQAFGHHPTSTSSVGGKKNPLAVLDTRLRVRGVENLRVVDASAFPRCPGAFPAVATFMLSEKATELVLEDAVRR